MSKNIKKLFLFVIIILSILLWLIFRYLFNYNKRSSIDDFPYVKENFDFLPKVKHNQIVRHTYYTLSYSEKHEQAEWVAYELAAWQVKRKVANRKDNFRPDSTIKTGSAALYDYKNSGYDRGHLVPAGDMRFSEIAMSESFYLSNIAPQDPAFNRGIWKRLENQIRRWTIENQTLYIVTGGVLEEGLPTIGKNKVAIPNYYYKVILDYSLPKIKAIAFLFPNKRGKKALHQYAVSIDKIEKITATDMFPDLPDNQEEILESNFDIEKWFYNKKRKKQIY